MSMVEPRAFYVVGITIDRGREGGEGDVQSILKSETLAKSDRGGIIQLYIIHPVPRTQYTLNTMWVSPFLCLLFEVTNARLNDTTNPDNPPNPLKLPSTTATAKDSTLALPEA